MTHSKKIDLMKVPGDRWGRREYLLSETLPDVLARSTEYVHNRYKLREQLEASCWFMENDLLDAPPGDGRSLIRIGFFPWTEAQHELSVALDHTLLGFHRASYGPPATCPGADSRWRMVRFRADYLCGCAGLDAF